MKRIKFKRKSVLVISMLVFVLISFPLLAEENELLIPEIDYHSFQLDNGLDVYVYEDDSIPIVESSIFYKLGSIDEEKGLTGISHFIEHTMFLGTDALAKGKMDDLISSVGGYNNAYTTYDHTSYYIEVPSSMLELAIAIEADRMSNLIIDPEEIKREREVIRQERRSRIENDVFEFGFEKIQAEAFPESSLNHQVIGWMEDINNITVEDIENYYHTYYVPNNAALVVTGDVKVEEVKELTEKYFSHYESKEIKRPDFIVEEQEEERFIEIESNTNLPYTVMLYKIPEAGHPDYIAVATFLDLFINMQSSRIIQNLQINNNLILGAVGLPYTFREPGFALIYQVPMDHSLVEKAQEAFDNELERVLEEGIDKEELEIVKKAAAKQLIFQQRNPESMASSIAVGKLNHDNPDLVQERLNYLEQLTEESIVEIAKKYFIKNNRTVGNIVPKT